MESEMNSEYLQQQLDNYGHIPGELRAPMTTPTALAETSEAIRRANIIMDKPYLDPDDLCLLARQFLRSRETIEALRASLAATEARAETAHNGLKAANRAAELALFVIRKHGVMPNSSWEGGFSDDMAKASAAIRALAEKESK